MGPGTETDLVKLLQSPSDSVEHSELQSCPFRHHYLRAPRTVRCPRPGLAGSARGKRHCRRRPGRGQQARGDATRPRRARDLGRSTRRSGACGAQGPSPLSPRARAKGPQAADLCGTAVCGTGQAFDQASSVRGQSQRMWAADISPTHSSARAPSPVRLEMLEPRYRSTSVKHINPVPLLREYPS